MAESPNGTNGSSFRRFAIWGFQSLLTLVCIFLWSMIQEMRIEIAQARGERSGFRERFVGVESGFSRATQDINEIKVSVKQMESNMQELRILVLEKTRK